MNRDMTQIKFTIDADIVSAFKNRCAAEGVSMASVVRAWMITGNPEKTPKIKIETRPHRKKAILEIISMLSNILESESDYRDRIPEQFEQRHEASDHSCDSLEQAIACLEEAY